MKYIVEDEHGDELVIEDGSTSVNLTIRLEDGEQAFAALSPSAVREVQFALQRAREATEKAIAAREGYAR